MKPFFQRFSSLQYFPYTITAFCCIQMYSITFSFSAQPAASPAALCTPAARGGRWGEGAAQLAVQAETL
jgi:hypothetical protein